MSIIATSIIATSIIAIGEHFVLASAQAGFLYTVLTAVVVSSVRSKGHDWKEAGKTAAVFTVAYSAILTPLLALAAFGIYW